MVAFSAVPILFLVFYLLPGTALIRCAWEDKQIRFGRITLAILLSIVLTPLTFSLLSWAVPGNDTLQLGAYLALWALVFAGIRYIWPSAKKWLLDFGTLPNADKTALLFSVLLTAIVVSLRLSIFQGNASQVPDDHYNMAKVSSFAATGLPSLYARQPLYAFEYYDLDYIAPGLWVRYSSGAIGIALAWTVHVGVQTFAVSLFLSRLIYMFAKTRVTRLFGLLALHAATGLDLFLLPWLSDPPHLDSWMRDFNWFDGYIQIIMPITLYVWMPQHLLGVAVVGLIYYFSTSNLPKGFPRAFAVGLLLVALFRTSTFVFIGLAPGLALWHLSELLTRKERLRQLFHSIVTALVAFAFVLPYLTSVLNKRSYLEFGLRSFVFLDIPVIPWLKYPITILVYLFIEIGILLPLLLWLLMRPRLYANSGRLTLTTPSTSGQTPSPDDDTKRALRFWLCAAVGFLIPFVAKTPLFNDIAKAGSMPAQLAAAMIACFMLARWGAQRTRVVSALVALQLVLSFASVGTELYYRATEEIRTIPTPSRWIASNTQPTSLVFYEQDTDLQDGLDRMLEINYGQRMSFVQVPETIDLNFTPVAPTAWRCMPGADLYDANSLCSIEALIPGAQAVYVKYLSSAPALDSPSFIPMYEAEDGSVFSLSCPTHDEPEFSEPPLWMHEPYHNLRSLLAEIPPDHAIAATTDDLIGWLRQEGYEQRLHEIVLELDGETVDKQSQLSRKLGVIDEISSPIWFLLDYTLYPPWNDQVHAHIQGSYYAAQPNVARSQWLPCKQRVVLALPATVDELSAVHSDVNFGEKLVVNEWRVASRPRHPGEIVAIELDWSKLGDEQLKFFVHLLDENWNLYGQIDLPAANNGTDDAQLTRMGLYVPANLSPGSYQVRLGVYRATDGQRLALPSGEDSLHIPLTVSQ